MRRLISTDKQSLEQFTQVIIVGKKFYLWRRLEQQISLLLLHHFLSLSFSLSLSLTHTHTHTHTHRWSLIPTLISLNISCACESPTIKKAECWRTDAFELWCWRRLLRAHWIARSNQLILKEINPEYLFIFIDAEALILWLPDSKNPTYWKSPWC